MSTITNLVFEGGGVKGIAYAGALQVLEGQGILQQLQGVAGTSAGAITACLLSLRFSAGEVHQMVSSMDFSSFADHENIIDKYKYYGMHPGEAFLDWLKSAIQQKGLSPDLTFQDLKDKGLLDLRVYACDINARKLQEFSLRETPTVKVAEAVRASMSIPLYFNAWQFPDHNPNAHLFVDGGMVYNYPIFAFDEGGDANMSVLGFRLEDIHAVRKPADFGFGSWISYVKNTFETLLDSQTMISHRDPDEITRTVTIDDLGIPATDFDITAEQKTALFNAGVTATEVWVKKG
jgi:NTE family protein